MPDDVAAVTELDIAAAADALRAGAVVAIPTDTVYGLAVDPSRRGGTDRLFTVKQRPVSVEIPVLVAGPDQAQALAGPGGLAAPARRLAAAFWPGSLTIVMARDPSLGWDLGGDSRTVGVRCPAHAVARRLCRDVGPLATTSANRHGGAPLVTAAAVRDAFGDDVAVVIDGGTCDGVPSTVVDVSGPTVACVRDGAVPW
ncbi:MAG: L-threonylcarbamoyladenylate synthase, partial [Acidimicrobiales bacterium]